jgi:hypothetical protein
LPIELRKHPAIEMECDLELSLFSFDLSIALIAMPQRSCQRLRLPEFAHFFASMKNRVTTLLLKAPRADLSRSIPLIEECRQNQS